MSMNFDNLLKTLSEEFAYQGFDPRITKAEFERKAINRPPQTIQKDLLILITIVLTRGTSFITKQKRSKEQAISDFNSIKAAYNLVASNNTTRADPKALTLSRICLAYPQLTTLSLNNNSLSVKGRKPPGLVKALCWPGAPSVIPTSWGRIYGLWLVWAESFDSVINPGGTLRQRRQRLMNLRNISKTAWESTFFENTKRLQLMSKISQADILADHPALEQMDMGEDQEEFLRDRGMEVEESASQRYEETAPLEHEEEDT